MLAVMILLMIGVGHLGNIAAALAHIAQTFSTPVEIPDDDRRER